MRTSMVLAIALALAACVERPRVASAPPTVESLILAATSYVCPEPDPAQPNCRVDLPSPAASAMPHGATKVRP